MGSDGQERLREPGHEWCLGGARTAGRRQCERAERSPGKGLCQVLQSKAKSPWRAVLAHSGGKKAFLPPVAAHKRPSWWCRSSRQECRPEGVEELGQVVMLNGAEKGKKPMGSSASMPRGKFLPEPRAGTRLFLERGSETWLLVPQGGHACQEMAKASSPSSWRHVRGF